MVSQIYSVKRILLFCGIGSALLLINTYTFINYKANVINILYTKTQQRINETNFNISQSISERITHKNISHKSHGISCYREKFNSLQDITEVVPKKGKSIFFHETSCNSYDNGKITITARQACAVESAAFLHPNHQVYLLFTSPGELTFENSESDRVLQALLTYPNVYIKHLNYEKYTANTPLEKLYKSGAIEKSKFPQSHASDVLRYLTLWKYGGIYLDLDLIVIKNLEDLALNYAGAESDQNVASGVMSFSPDGVGHELVESCVYDLKNKFNGKVWGNNGPGVVTRMLEKNCDVKKAKEMQKRPCKGFKVYPIETFYAVPWRKWAMYFNEKTKKEVFKMSRNSYVVHVWNKKSWKSKIPLDVDVAYNHYARQFCPKVYNQLLEYF